MPYNDSPSAAYGYGRFIDLAVEGRVDVTRRTLTIILQQISMGSKTKTEINLTIFSKKNSKYDTFENLYIVLYIGIILSRYPKKSDKIPRFSNNQLRYN